LPAAESTADAFDDIASPVAAAQNALNLRRFTRFVT
jgi:hypothetical protein